MGARDPVGTNRLACPRRWESRARGGGDAHPAAWSLHSIDIWVLNSVGADLSRAGIGRGPTHRCRARQSLGPPPPTPGLAASAAEQGLVRCRMGARELPAPPRLCSPESAGAEPGKMLGRAGRQEGAFEDFSVLSSTGWAQPAPCP